MLKAFTTAKEHNGFIKVNSCGKQLLADMDYNTLRENGRVDFSLYYVKQGVGYVEDSGENHIFRQGNLVLFPPNTQQHYFFKKEDSSQMLWVHFSGNACELLDFAHDNKPIIVAVKDRKIFEAAFEKMIQAHYTKYTSEDILCDGYMFFLLALIKESIEFSPATNDVRLNLPLKMVLSDMSINFNGPIDIKKYAAMCHLSEDSFIRMFKKNMGCPPYRYQLKIRIERAVELLENSGMNVYQCGEAVGFPDNAYFCRIFKKFTGHTPSYYKK